ncbi:MAG: hypothetical protein OXU81_11045 [Gammaproteobacteria bacterium]|nr:hypothetical protein [Gammaproteobacteria bacterium]
MTIKNATLTAAAAVLAAGLAGCWEDTAQVTVHNPGEYKGEPDPLLAQSASARAGTLTERFQRVQVDR